jgi:membrane associated rhomboid family serine protease
MGIYDRDYIREEPKGLVFSRPQSAVVTIILINVAVFLVDFVGGSFWLNEHLALGSDLFRTGHVWELFTSGFAHGDVWHIAFNMLALWWFGTEVEVIYGRKAFWQLYLSTMLLSGLCWAVSQAFIFHDFNAHAVGASGAIAGILIVYVFHYPTKVCYVWGVVPVPMWLLATIWVGQDLFVYHQMALGAEDAERIAREAHLGGALFGFVYYRWGWTLFSLIPSRLLRTPVAALKRPKLRVHEPEFEESDLEEEVDRILAKIHSHGTESLTEEEQRTLQRASRVAQRRRR